MRTVSGRNCRENQNKPFVFNNFFPENRAVYAIMWKNTVDPDRTQMTTWRMRIACWIPKVTHTYSEHIILFIPLQQWLRERASMLRYMHIACPFSFSVTYFNVMLATQPSSTVSNTYLL